MLGNPQTLKPVSKSINLTVSHPRIPAGPIEGFRFMWAFYVRGYKPEFHCQRCFIGRRVDEFSTPTASSGMTIVLDRLDRYPLNTRAAKNLQFAVAYLGHSKR